MNEIKTLTINKRPVARYQIKKKGEETILYLKVDKNPQKIRLEEIDERYARLITEREKTAITSIKKLNIK